MIWREKRIWLIVLGIALLADVFVFVTYRVQFQKRIDAVESSKEQAKARLAQAHAARLAAQDNYARYVKVQTDLDALYNTRWATRDERLIPWISEIKRLAEASQLVPRVINFTKAEDKEKDKPTGPGLTPSGKGKDVGTSSVSIAYNVQGNYQQVRRLINLLELSDQFVIIDALTVTATDDPNVLNVSLRLKTLFREPITPAGQPLTQSTTAATGPAANQVM